MNIQEFLNENPQYSSIFLGVFSIIIGGFMLAASVFNWDWIFKGNSWNPNKIEGTANFWGRGFARLKFGLGGLGCIISGIVLVVLFFMR